MAEIFTATKLFTTTLAKCCLLVLVKPVLSLPTEIDHEMGNQNDENFQPLLEETLRVSNNAHAYDVILADDDGDSTDSNNHDTDDDEYMIPLEMIPVFPTTFSYDINYFNKQAKQWVQVQNACAVKQYDEFGDEYGNGCHTVSDFLTNTEFWETLINKYDAIIENIELDFKTLHDKVLLQAKITHQQTDITIKKSKLSLLIQNCQKYIINLSMKMLLNKYESELALSQTQTQTQTRVHTTTEQGYSQQKADNNGFISCVGNVCYRIMNQVYNIKNYVSKLFMTAKTKTKMKVQNFLTKMNEWDDSSSFAIINSIYVEIIGNDKLISNYVATNTESITNCSESIATWWMNKCNGERLKYRRHLFEKHKLNKNVDHYRYTNTQHIKNVNQDWQNQQKKFKHVA